MSLVGNVQAGFNEVAADISALSSRVENADAAAALALTLRPWTWQVGTEYDLGDGAFGRRFTGTVTAAASAQSWTTHITGGINRIFCSGGWWRVSTSNAWGDTFLPVGAVYIDGTESFTGFMRTQTNGNLTMFTKSTQARTNAAYDVWAIYSKNIEGGGLTVDSDVISPHPVNIGNPEFDFAAAYIAARAAHGAHR
ncbi:MAG: hypothetical protein LBP58_03230 [Azoarcus sp.]|jgi:hypothetical protein|nr:hypothetical protein [Azoarcus sp.]